MGWDSSTGILTKSFTANNLRSALELPTTNEEVDAAGYFNGTLGKINYWSPQKPIRSDARYSVNMADYNYGFSTENLIQSGSNVFTVAKQYKTWQESWYLKPRGHASYNEWYRWEDFNGYNKNAVAPFTYENLPLSTSTIISSVDIRIDKVSNSIDPSQMDAFSGKKYAILYRTGMNEPDAAFIDTNLSTSSMLIFPCTFDESGTYEFIFCAVKDPYQIGDDAFWMPGGYFTRQVSATGGGSTIITSTFTVKLSYANINPTVDWNSYTINMGMIGIESITRDTGSATSASAHLSFTFKGYNSSGDERFSFVVEDVENGLLYPNSTSVNFNDGSSISMEQYISQQGGDISKLDSIISIEIYASIHADTKNTNWSLNRIYSWTINKN